MATMTNISFRTLIKEYIIRIPEIQRDYAQGRDNEKATKIREGFIGSLLPVFAGSKDVVPLDFIYGYCREDRAFEPLDGQQRLTTLFLVHWLFCPDNCEDLFVTENGERRSRFRYATRISSEQFCDALVNQSASKLVECWRQFLESAKETQCKDETRDCGNEGPFSFSKFISGLSWFEWTWRYDPTVMAMLNTMDTILASLVAHRIQYRDVQYENLDCIVFHRLDLNDNLFSERDGYEFKLGDELYVKMNSRGKELSEFDKLKSTLEEELQSQKEEGRVDERIEVEWRTAMDGIWADYFWQAFRPSEGISASLDISAEVSSVSAKVSSVVFSVEEPYRRFLTRVVAFSLLESMESSRQPSENLFLDSWKELKDACESTDDKVVEAIVETYATKIRLVRQAGGNSADSFPRLNFRGILADLGKVIQRTSDSEVGDITSIACPELRWEPTDSRQSMLQDFIAKSLSRDRRLEYSAILSFVRNIDTSNLAQDETKKECLRDWLRFTRNCILPRNVYQRVGTPVEEANVRRFLQKQISSFGDKVQATPTLSMRQFIGDLEWQRGDQVEQANIEEEKTKAKLRTDPEWKKLLDNAEDNSYLWGQLRALLDWAKNPDGTHNRAVFERFARQLCSIFPVKAENQDKFWKALLCLDDYRMVFNEKKTLVTFDDNRDASWKQYLRKKPDVGLVAPILKRFIDIWLETGHSSLDFDAFLDKLLSERSPSVADWRRYVLGVKDLSTEFCPSMGFLVDNNGSEIDGHKWFFPKKQISESRRSWELVCAYLRSRKCADGIQSVLNDSLNPDTRKKNSIEFLREGTVFVASVQAIAGGMYLFRSSSDSPGETVDANTAVQRIENLGLVV